MMASKNDIKELQGIVSMMTLREKLSILSGDGFWKTDEIKRLGVDSITMTDGPHGIRREKDFSDSAIQSESIPATCFPTAATLACSFDRSLIKSVGEMLGDEASDLGVDVVLGPGVNIKRSPLCGRNFEYFSEDPFLAGELAASMINGMQSRGTGACIKHFAVNNQEDKRMVVDSCVDKRALFEIYLEAFRIAVEKATPWSLMSSYNRLNGQYSGENPFLMDTLRKDFGFDGLVMSDWGAVFDRVAGVKAGLDLEMPGKTSDTAHELSEALKKGEITEAEIDRAVMNILILVKRCKSAKKPALAKDLYEKAHVLVRKASGASSVLLKNDGGLLPFDDKKPFAVIGGFAKSARYQGAGSSRIIPFKLGGIIDELNARELSYEYAEGYLPDGSTNDALIAAAREAATKAGRAVIVAGLPDAYESEGFDRQNLNMPDGMLKLIDSVASVCDKVAVVLMLGAPVVLPFEARVKSILCAYLGGEAVGEAVVDLITGKVNPSGKLAESWPVNLESIPCSKYFCKNKKLAFYAEGKYVGYRYYDAANVAPKYEFGFGLSYTKFDLEGVRLSKRSLKAGEDVAVLVNVKNTGKRSGAEVVEVYVGKKGEAFKELKGFEKVELFAGESKSVEIRLPYDSFSYYDVELNRRNVLAGEYSVYVGTSSRDIKSEHSLKLDGDAKEEPAYFEAKTANNRSEAEFFSTLGYVPEEAPTRPFTLNSTINELRYTGAGKLFYKLMMKILLNDQSDESAKAMVINGLLDTPIRQISGLSKGTLKKPTAKMIVSFANGKVLKGIGYAFKKH